jgi:hypothetical protein
MRERDRYTPDEWRTLQLAPFWILSGVVGAYRRVAERDRLAELFRREPRFIGVGLFQVDAVLHKAGPEEAARFKDMLVVEIGEEVARARGRYGTEMSDDDKAVALAAQLLAVDRYPVEE